jgi:hypothetical protein
MVQRVFEPIPIRYHGLFADDHLVDAQQFGTSVASVSRVATSLSHFFFFHQITHDTRAYQIKFFVGPSKENGLLQEIVAVMNSGLMPVFSPVMLKFSKIIVEKLFDAVIKSATKQKSEAAMAIEGIHDLAVKHNEFAKQVHEGHMRDKKWLQDTVSQLVAENRAPLRGVPEPVGRSVREMIVGDPGQRTIIDEPSAEVLRSREDLEVGEAKQYVVDIEGVFKTNGACRVRLQEDGSDRVVSGKITDPELELPGNVYTTALDQGQKLRVTAKPTIKDGEVYRLFISDAKIVR